MKTIFYECLLKERTSFPEPNDRIIYSYLVYKSIATADMIFCGGQFDKDTFSDYMKRNTSGIIRKFSIPKTALDLSLSFNTVKSRMCFLQKSGFINQYVNENNPCDIDIEVQYLPDVGASKFFELLAVGGLKGMNRIVFSYLYAKARTTGYIVTPDYKQSAELGLSRKHYQKIICELKQLGLIKRLKGNRLQIL